MSATHAMILRRAAQVVCVCASGERHLAGAAQNTLHIVENASVVVALDGKIEFVGPADDADAKYATAVFAEDIDARGKSVVPGMCDGHTHPVFSGDRVHEFALKLEGASYMDIHKAGGGIGFTVKHTRESEQSHLEALFSKRLDRMLRLGTTLVEAKSGYGLERDTEMKMLRVLHNVGHAHAVDVIGNFCGAHSVPKGLTAEQATRDVIDVQIPELVRLRDAGEVSPSMIDVFCEKGVFERDHTREILKAGVAAGLEINFHGDEIAPTQSGELGGELGALAISHLERVSEDGIKAMAARPTVGVLLPTTAYILRLEPPPARALIEGNVPVALGSDFNPNAHCMSMPMVMHLACVNMRLTMPEALVAATINGAASMGVSDMHGSIEVGKWGNLLLLDHADWRHLIYEMVDPPIARVIVHGATKVSNE